MATQQRAVAARTDEFGVVVEELDLRHLLRVLLQVGHHLARLHVPDAHLALKSVTHLHAARGQELQVVAQDYVANAALVRVVDGPQQLRVLGQVLKYFSKPCGSSRPAIPRSAPPRCSCSTAASPRPEPRTTSK